MCLGVPGRIISIDETEGLRMGMVDFGGVARRICLAYVPEAILGDYVVVHAGFAISQIDADEAAATLATLQALGDPDLAALREV